MSGSWLKIELTTPDKPEVLQMAETLQIDVDAVFGKLFRVWSWFDEHTLDGHAPSVTINYLNRIVGIQNFCEAMIATSWMEQGKNGISIPNFTRHNTKPSKDRALANIRKQQQRQKGIKMSDKCPTVGSTKVPAKYSLEKRKEDKYIPTEKIPTLDDCIGYANEKELGCDAKRFYFYWEEKSWRGVSNWKNKMQQFNTYPWAQKQVAPAVGDDKNRDSEVLL